MFLGKYEVNVLTLQTPPEEYMARDINTEWTSALREKIVRQPTLISTVFPVLLDPKQVIIILFSNHNNVFQLGPS